MKAVAVWISNIEIVFWYLNHALNVSFDIENLIFDIIADDKDGFWPYYNMKNSESPSI